MTNSNSGGNYYFSQFSHPNNIQGRLHSWKFIDNLFPLLLSFVSLSGLKKTMKIGIFVTLFAYSSSAYAVPVSYSLEGFLYHVDFQPQISGELSGEMVIDSDFQWIHKATTFYDNNYGRWLVQSISMHSDAFVFNGSGYIEYSQLNHPGGAGSFHRYGIPFILGTGNLLDYSGNMSIMEEANLTAVVFYNFDGSQADTCFSLPYKMVSIIGWDLITNGSSGPEHFAHFSFTATEITPVPEPATTFLFGIGLASLAAVSRRKRV